MRSKAWAFCHRQKSNAENIVGEGPALAREREIYALSGVDMDDRIKDCTIEALSKIAINVGQQHRKELCLGGRLAIQCSGSPDHQQASK